MALMMPHASRKVYGVKTYPTRQANTIGAESRPMQAEMSGAFAIPAKLCA